MTNDNFRKQYTKRLYTFALNVIATIDSLPKKDVVSWRLGDQLLRSGTSIIGNYVEGGSASSTKDFINYQNTCLKSTNESKLWICLLRDSKRLNPQSAKLSLNELEEFSKIFAASIISLKKKTKKNVKS